MVRAEIKAMQSEVKKDHLVLIEMKNRVDEVRSNVAVVANTMFNKNSTPKTRLQKEVDRTLCVLRSFSTEKLIATVITKCLICHCVKMFKYGDIRHNYSLGSTILSLMNFSVQPNERKNDKYETTVGKQFSIFRHGVLMSSFLALCSISVVAGRDTLQKMGSGRACLLYTSDAADD